MSRSPNPERKVELALEGLVEKGVIPHFIHAEQNDRLDSNGVDFLIFFNGGSGLALPIQIKGESGKSSRHRRKYPHIPVVLIIKSNVPIKNVQKLLIQTMKSYWNGFAPMM